MEKDCCEEAQRETCEILGPLIKARSSVRNSGCTSGKSWGSIRISG